MDGAVISEFVEIGLEAVEGLLVATRQSVDGVDLSPLYSVGEISKHRCEGEREKERAEIRIHLQGQTIRIGNPRRFDRGKRLSIARDAVAFDRFEAFEGIR